jgi:hypothetical protein
VENTTASAARVARLGAISRAVIFSDDPSRVCIVVHTASLPVAVRVPEHADDVHFRCSAEHFNNFTAAIYNK